MKPIAILTLASAALLSSCVTLTPREGAVAMDAVTIAQTVGTAAAAVYGGPLGAEYGAAGLSALATVAQGYIGRHISTGIVQASPGVDAVANVAASIVTSKRTVTQADVNTLWTAASILANKSAGLDPSNQVATKVHRIGISPGLFADWSKVGQARNLSSVP